MSVTTYQQWRDDGSPWRPAPVIKALHDLLVGHGYTVGVIGDSSHLTADPPEDHTPYSHTPWPAGQPYPCVLALDIMPGGPVDYRHLGAQIVADRAAGVAGTEWIKYVNWTDPASGACVHTSWEPDRADRASTDRGHVHVSARSDRFTMTSLRGWDPVHRASSGVIPTAPPASSGPTLTATEKLVRSLPLVKQGSTGQPVRNMQSLLNGHGADLKVDGIDGPVTTGALAHFQVTHHVPNSVRSDGTGDGQCGANSWAALLDVA